MFRFFGKRKTLESPPPGLDPRWAAGWIDTLPPFAPLETLTALHGALKQMNEAAGPGQRRVETLAPFRAKLHDLFRVFPTPAMQQNLHSGRERIQANAVMEKALHRLAGGYNLALAVFLEQRRELQENSPFIRAAWGSMGTNVLRLRHAFRSYGPVPRHVYLDLHRVFVLAEQQRALYLPSPFGQAEDEPRSLGLLYKQILLLAVADPFHMSHGEADGAFGLLGEFAEAAEIKPIEDWHPLAGQFLLDTSSDSPPTPLAEKAPPVASEKFRILDMRPAITRVLQAEINRRVSARHRLKADRSQWLMDHLTRRFRGETQRRHVREPAHWSALAVTGIPAVVATIDEGSAKLDGGGPIAMAALGDGDDHATVNRWTIVDQSVSGFSLMQEAPADPMPRVGDVMALVDEADVARNSPFTLCLIQWLRFSTGDRLNAGLEILSRSPIAARVRPEGRDAAAAIPVLVVPPARGADRHSYLLVQREGLKENLRYTLTGSGGDGPLRLGPRAPFTSVVDRYILSPSRTSQ